jgi:AcrR family transcriptional regulator
MSVCLRRRRGNELEEAIRAAAYAELLAVGYSAFTVEGVAARARTGKASIYRRWPSKTSLILDSVSSGMSGVESCDATFAIEADTTTADALRIVATRIAAVLDSPIGDAIRAIKTSAASDPELARAIDKQFQAPRRAALVALLRRGVDRGEVRPEALTESVLQVLPAMLTYRVVMLQQSLSETDVVAIVDEVLIPLVSTSARTDSGTQLGAARRGL